MHHSGFEEIEKEVAISSPFTFTIDKLWNYSFFKFCFVWKMCDTSDLLGLSMSSE